VSSPHPASRCTDVTPRPLSLVPTRFGDRPDLNLPPAEAAVLSQVVGKGVPVVVLLLAGRPLVFDLSGVDAVMMAWLPGTECEGVADVLLGDYAPTGRMPVTLPRGLEVPGEVAELYAAGAGLTYPDAGRA
jgi:beta-glucosidase